MPRLAKQYYYNGSNEKKINCYKISIPKKIVEQSKIKDGDSVKIYADGDKIVIEKEK